MTDKAPPAKKKAAKKKVGRPRKTPTAAQDKYGLPMSPGAPKGRNRAKMIQEAVAEALLESLEHDAQLILCQAIRMAKKGDKAMIKLLLDKALPQATFSQDDPQKGKTSISISISNMEDKGSVIDAEVVDDNG